MKMFGDDVRTLVTLVAATGSSTTGRALLAAVAATLAGL